MKMLELRIDVSAAVRMRTPQTVAGTAYLPDQPFADPPIVILCRGMGRNDGASKKQQGLRSVIPDPDLISMLRAHHGDAIAVGRDDDFMPDLIEPGDFLLWQFISP